MFEKLHYSLFEDNDRVAIYRKPTEEIIYFHKFLKEYMAYYDNEVLEAISITMSLQRAINQKCRELGWLDE